MGEELTLEECFSGLEEIIEKMQDTEVSLEDSFALYEPVSYTHLTLPTKRIV